MVPPKKLSASGRVTAKKPMRVEVLIPLDPEEAGRVVELRRKRDELTARLQRDTSVQSDLDVVSADLEDAEDVVRANSVKFVALSIGKNRWKELQAKYPPTNEQKRDAKRDGYPLPFNPDLMTPAAFRECLHMVDVDDDGREILSDLTDELVNEMFEGDDGAWNDAELLELWTACARANGSQHQVGDLGNG